MISNYINYERFFFPYSAASRGAEIFKSLELTFFLTFYLPCVVLLFCFVAVFLIHFFKSSPYGPAASNGAAISVLNTSSM